MHLTKPRGEIVNVCLADDIPRANYRGNPCQMVPGTAAVGDDAFNDLFTAVTGRTFVDMMSSVKPV